MSAKITSVDDFLRAINSFDKQKLLFRGQSDFRWAVKSSSSRRFSDFSIENPVAYQTISNYHLDLIKGAKARNRYNSGIEHMDELEILSELQHFGAATLLIDFTWSYLVALYFACTAENVDGAVFVIDPVNSSMKGVKKNQFRFEDFFNDSTIYSLVPSVTNARIAAQKAHFLFHRSGMISDRHFVAKLIIENESKIHILRELRLHHSISEQDLFPDFSGFAIANRPSSGFNKDDSYYYFQVGIRAAAANDYDASIKNLVNAATLKPDVHNVWCSLGKYYLAQGKHVEAKDALSKAIRLSPDCHNALYSMANLCMDENQLDSALMYFDRSLQATIAREIPASDTQLIWFNKAVTLRRLNRVGESNHCYKEALKVNPHYLEAWRNLSLNYRSQNEIDLQIQCLKNVIAIRPDEYLAYWDLASAYRAKERKTSEIKYAKLAVKVTPDEAQALVRLACIFFDHKDFKKFTQTAKRALKHDNISKEETAFLKSLLKKINQ